MANNFVRQAREGSDYGVWAQYQKKQDEISLSLLTNHLYNDSGALKLSIGKIGLWDSSDKGICIIDTVTTIDMSGVSSGNWAKIEISKSGTAVTIAATDITGATDETTVPTEFTDAYDGEKGAYYIDSEKRCVGIVWKTGAGALKKIINANSGRDYGENTKYITTLTSDTTLSNQSAKQRYYISTDTNSVVITLDSASSQTGNELYFIKSDSGTGTVSLLTSSGDFFCILQKQGQKIGIESDGSDWFVIDGNLTLYSGNVYRSDWTSVLIGFVALNYTGKSGTIGLGKFITEATSGNTGVVIYDSGTVLTLVHVTDDGNGFTNGRTITSDSGGTATVNGNTKNVDSYATHRWIKDITEIDFSMKLENGSIYRGTVGNNGDYGIRERYLTTSSIAMYTGANGFYYITNGAATIQIIDSEDWRYELCLKVI